MAMEKTPYSFQVRCLKWILAWLNSKLVWNKQERNQRFLEEALELVQSLDMDRETAHALVDYVFGRPKGEPSQELGGVMNTIALLAETNSMSMWHAGEEELSRCWDNIEKIKAKQLLKPNYRKFSDRVGVYDENDQQAELPIDMPDPLGR